MNIKITNEIKFAASSARSKYMYLDKRKSLTKTESGQKREILYKLEGGGYLKQKKNYLEKDMTEMEKRANILADETEASRNIVLLINYNEFRKILKEKKGGCKNFI